jgi:DNA-binding CsgD family transcriptional regulator
MASLLAAPTNESAKHLSILLREFVGHIALVILDVDDVGNPLKTHGDASVTSHVTYSELELVKASLSAGGNRLSQAHVGGVSRSILSALARTGAVLTLVDPDLLREENVLTPLWEIVAEHLQHQAREASPAFLIERRTAASARVEAVNLLGDRHMTTLESLLAILRSRDLDDRAARQAATKLAAEAAVHLRTATDHVLTFTEEPVTSAFERLRNDLRPLVKYRDIDVQFVEPPVDGRALPSEVAHGARAVVRGAILALVDEAEVSRIRVHWDCDGKNLLVNVRDNGPGNLTANSSQLQPLRQRVLALDGRISMNATIGWGCEMSVVLPLDPPPLLVDQATATRLSARELQVVECIVGGLTNRRIAAHLGISENTVKFHVSKIFRKLTIRSRAELAGVSLGYRGITGPNPGSVASPSPPSRYY